MPALTLGIPTPLQGVEIIGGAAPRPCAGRKQFLLPYIVIGSFLINEIKLLSFVISLLVRHARRLRSLIGMGYYDDGLSGQDHRARAANG
jgi:hypothetical protein